MIFLTCLLELQHKLKALHLSFIHGKVHQGSGSGHVIDQCCRERDLDSHRESPSQQFSAESDSDYDQRMRESLAFHFKPPRQPEKHGAYMTLCNPIVPRFIQHADPQYDFDHLRKLSIGPLCKGFPANLPGPELGIHIDLDM